MESKFPLCHIPGTSHCCVPRPILQRDSANESWAKREREVSVPGAEILFCPPRLKVLLSNLFSMNCRDVHSSASRERHSTHSTHGFLRREPMLPKQRESSYFSEMFCSSCILGQSHRPSMVIEVWIWSVPTKGSRFMVTRARGLLLYHGLPWAHSWTGYLEVEDTLEAGGWSMSLKGTPRLSPLLSLCFLIVTSEKLSYAVPSCCVSACHRPKSSGTSWPWTKMLKPWDKISLSPDVMPAMPSDD